MPVHVIRGCHHTITAYCYSLSYMLRHYISDPCAIILMQLKQTSLLVTNHKTCRVSWSYKQKRMFSRLISGLNHHIKIGSRIRIMTLTSAAGNRSKYLDLNRNWQVLRKRIMRRYGALHYWRLRTFEGLGEGVLHIVYIGSYIPVRWISKNWQEIHGAKIVYMQELKARYGSKRIASYMITNYFSHHSFSRQSWSWGWVFRGFVGYFKKLIKTVGYHEALIRWKYVLMNIDPKKRLDILFGDYFKQTRLKKLGRYDTSFIVL